MSPSDSSLDRDKPVVPTVIPDAFPESEPQIHPEAIAEALIPPAETAGAHDAMAFGDDETTGGGAGGRGVAADACAAPADGLEGRIADAEDIVRAQREPEACAERMPLWKRIGPGLVTGAADDDPVNVGSYSVAGARFGYGMVWLLPLAAPLMIAVQEMCGRVAAVTGRGFAGVLRQHYPRWVLWPAVLLLSVSNTISIWADLNVMAASAQLLAGGPFAAWLAVMTAVTLGLQVFVPYQTYVRYLKWLTLAMAAYVVTALMPAVGVEWGRVARGLIVPRWETSPQYFTTLVALLGTSISPYLFFWQAGETVEEVVAEGKADESGHRVERVSESEIRCLRADTVVGMVASLVISFAVMLCAAASLNARGMTEISTAKDAAEALRPLGPAAYALFTMAIVAAGLLAVPTLAGSAAYALSEAAGWRFGLFRRLRRAPGFYGVIIAAVLVGAGLNLALDVNPIRAVVIAAVLNALIAGPLIVLLLLIGNNRRIMGTRRNGRLSNLVGGIAAAVMLAAAGVTLWSLVP